MNSTHPSSPVPPDSSEVLKKFATQQEHEHAVEKASKQSMTSYKSVIQMTSSVIWPVVSPIIIALGLIISAGSTYKKITDYFHIKFKPNSNLAAIRKMKKQEESSKLQIMKKVIEEPSLGIASTDKPKSAVETLTKSIKDKLSPDAVKKNKIPRQILRLLAQKAAYDPEKWKAALHFATNFLKENEISNKTGFNDFIVKLKEEHGLTLDPKDFNWAQISSEAEKYEIPSADIDKELEKFDVALTKLLSLLKEAGENPASDNPKIIQALRAALSSPVYQAVKEDPNEPSVKLLHRLASDIWNKVPAMNAYKELGENIKALLPPSSSLVDTDNLVAADSEEGVEIAEQLEESQKIMAKKHYTDHGVLSKIGYAATHVEQAFGSLASEGGAARQIAALVGKDTYDSHGTLSNNPSLQGTTTLSLQRDGSTKKATLNNCYGGSPTIGDHEIAPEFEALLQAAENNQLAEQPDKNIPLIVNYNNLQDLDKLHGEGPRSRAIMLLNEKYPLSFRGTTFSKDSDLYLGKEVVFTTAVEFGKRMKEQFKASFDPTTKGHGFYFHGSFEKWEGVFDQAIANANEYFDPDRCKGKEPFELQGAYQEYVYSLITAAIELDAATELIDRGFEDILIMILTACKENIDRGGFENTKILYNRLEEGDSDKLDLLLGAMHSRALSARDRVILKKRLTQILQFIRSVPSKTFQEKQAEFLEKLSGYAVESQFRPYLPEEEAPLAA